eukprot:363764-Chlamydomonas_euryale.AAC.10
MLPLSLLKTAQGHPVVRFHVQCSVWSFSAASTMLKIVAATAPEPTYFRCMGPKIPRSNLNARSWWS